MKRVLFFFVLAAAICAPAQNPVNSNAVCDGQQDYIAAMKPMLDELSKNVVAPYGRTTEDVSKFLEMALSFGLGSRCSWLRINDHLWLLDNQLQVAFNQIAALEKRVAALEAGGTPSGDLTDIKNAIDGLRASVSLMQGQIKTAGQTLAK